MSLLSKVLSTQNVDVKTVDQFQGSDRDIIIYSCTKTSESARSGHQGESDSSRSRDSILDDERRLNVAVTRAKAKLVIVGNSKALKTYRPFAKMLAYLEENNMTYKVAPSDFEHANLLDVSIGH